MRQSSMFEFDEIRELDAWRPIHDGVMGGVSTGGLGAGSPSVAVFSGVVSLENSGGFASVRSAPLRRDLRGFDGIGLRVRGDAQRYKLSLKTDPSFDGPLYQARFTAAADWAELFLPFEEFVPTFRGRPLPAAPPLDRTQIWTFGLMISDRQAGRFRLELDWIRAVAERFSP